MQQKGNTLSLRHQFMQKAQPLRVNLRLEEIDPGRISGWPSQARDQAILYWIVTDAEYNWYRRGCSFGRNCGGGIARRDDHAYAPAGQTCHHFRQAIVTALQPMVFD